MGHSQRLVSPCYVFGVIEYSETLPQPACPKCQAAAAKPATLTFRLTLTIGLNLPIVISREARRRR